MINVMNYINYILTKICFSYESLFCPLLAFCLSLNCAVSSVDYLIGDFVSNQFVVLINKTQRGSISRSTMNTVDAANRAEPSVFIYGIISTMAS